MKRTMLFVCIHNSARSQMAEAFMNKYCKDCIEAQSAGIEPGKLNPVVVEAMREKGYDLSGNQTKSVFELFKSGQVFSYVVTVCDEASAERCPVVPGITQRFHWGFPDPSSFKGSPEEKLAFTRQVRDDIEAKIKAWCAEQCTE